MSEAQAVTTETGLPPMRCPACGKSDQLSLIERHEEVGETDPGVIHRDDRGNLIPPSEFMFEAGDPIGIEVRCWSCRHLWKPRAKAVATLPVWFAADQGASDA